MPPPPPPAQPTVQVTYSAELFLALYTLLGQFGRELNPLFEDAGITMPELYDSMVDTVKRLNFPAQELKQDALRQLAKSGITRRATSITREANIAKGALDTPLFMDR